MLEYLCYDMNARVISTRFNMFYSRLGYTQFVSEGFGRHAGLCSNLHYSFVDSFHVVFF